MNTSSNPTRTATSWMPSLPGFFPPAPKFFEVSTSVMWRLAELNCTAFNRGMERSLSSLQALSDVRDLSSFVAQQQKSMQGLWKDQEETLKAAAEVIRNGFEELQPKANGSASGSLKSTTPESSARTTAKAAPTPKATPTTKAAPTKIAAVRKVAATAPASVTDTGKAGPTDTIFEIYADKAGEYRFRLKAADGSVLLKSEGYKSRSSAVNGVASVKKNAKVDARYDKHASATGKPTFNLKAGNHQVIGSSKTFASADQMEAAIKLIKQTVATSKVDDQTRAA